MNAQLMTALQAYGKTVSLAANTQLAARYPNPEHRREAYYHLVEQHFPAHRPHITAAQLIGKMGELVSRLGVLMPFETKPLLDAIATGALAPTDAKSYVKTFCHTKY